MRSISRTAARRCASIGNGPGGAGGGGSAAWRLERRLDQIGQKARDLVEQPVDHRDRAARLVLVEERLVGAGSEPLGLDGGDLALRRSTRSSPGSTAAKSLCRPRLAPHQLAFRAGARDGLDEIAGHRGGMRAAAAHLAQIGALPLVRASASASASSSRSPISGAVRCWCAIRRKVASCSARAAAPPAGIIAAVSQCSTAIACSSAPIRRNRVFQLADRRSSRSRVAAMKQDIDDDQRNRQGKPRDRVLQMVVGQREAGDAALRPAAGVGRRVGVDVERRDPVEMVRRAIAGRSTQNQ